jgi:predicted DNA-binding transcriptional regulator AlpA
MKQSLLVGNAVEGSHTRPLDRLARLARPAEVARYFSIGRSTLFEWARRPGFPKRIKAGPRVTLFDIAAIEIHLREQCA